MNNTYILLFLCICVALAVVSKAKTPACRNKDKDCASWARDGECKKNPSFMKGSCRKACKWCGTKKTNTTPNKSCKDTDKDCPSWAKNGECKKNPSFMEESCKKSCKWCNKGNGNVEGKTGSCKGGIKKYPSSMPNSNFYKKICYSKKGLKIIASSKPSDAALNRAAFLLDKVVLKVNAAVIKSMNHYKFRHAVMATYPKEVTLDIPEHSRLGNDEDWNERARGLGASTYIPVGSSAEENLLCHSNDRYKGEDITIHEFAHSLHLVGLAPTFSNFNKKLASLYKKRKNSSRNPWKGKYAMENKDEYWAEAVQSYFGANMNAGKATTKSQFKKNDPEMFKFVSQYLGGVNWKFSC